jgi:isoquinoline 1-oxidoreductase subunit beta
LNVLRHPFAHSGDAVVDPLPSIGLSRRIFLKTAVAAAGGLLLSISLPRPIGDADAADTDNFAPGAFIRIGSDGSVTLIIGQVEMGQGTYTALPMLIAEELEVELRHVRIEHAPPDDKLFGHPLLGFQVTASSTSVRVFWDPLRTAGATARTMLVSAAAKNWKVEPNSCRAEKGEVIHSASGRRTRYGALAADAAKLPIPEHVVLKPPADFKLIGTPAKRLDAAEKVDGSAVYGIDVKLPGMKVATLAASPVFGGRVRSIDDTKAMAVRGVRQIVRLDDAVAVVADHMGAAKKGLAALDIRWNEGPNATLNTADLIRELQIASQGAGIVARRDGEVDKAMAAAVTKVEAVYQLPFLAHATMEPMNCTVDLRKDSCEVWVGTQVLTRAQAAAAQTAGLPLEKVRVHNHLLGGGFGRRLEIDGIVRAVQIAKHVDGPVKVVWTREEDIQHDMYRPYFFDRIAAGLDEHGNPVAWKHRITGSSITARWAPPAFKNGLDDDTVEGAAEPPYALPNFLVDYVRKEPPGIPTAFWRSVGPSHNIFVVESFIDELAATAKRDPVEYRSNLLGKNPRAKAVLELAAEKAGWGRPIPNGSARGVSVQFVFGTYMAQVAEVSVSKAGAVRVQRVVCAVDCGMVINPDTVRAQAESAIVFGTTAALHGEITLKNGRVEQTNFGDYPILRINEAPVVEVHIIQSAEPPGGMGEPGTAAVAPAITSAIYAATGKRIRRLPVAQQAAHTA